MLVLRYILQVNKTGRSLMNQTLVLPKILEGLRLLYSLVVF